MKLPKLTYISRERFLLQEARGKRVLDLGIVGDRKLGLGERTLHEQLLEVARELWGVDIDAAGIAQFVSRNPAAQARTFVGDVCQLESLPLPHDFELIIAGDLIEHLVEPKMLLDSCRCVLAPGGQLILTTPNSLGLLNVLRAASGHERVNPRHVMWFSFSTLEEFAGRCNWRVVQHRTGYDFEPSSLPARTKLAIGAAFFRIFPQWGGTLISALAPTENTAEAAPSS